jgi:hypothetical protein
MTAIANQIKKKSRKGAKPENLAVELERSMQELEALIKEHIIALAEVGHGHKFKRDANGFAAKTDVTVSITGVQVELPEYAEALDKGRKPGARKVPVSALVKWMKRYNLSAKKGGNINQAAFAIQNSIFKHGIKARPFLKKMQQFLDEAVQELIDTLIVPDILGILDTTFDNN